MGTTRKDPLHRRRRAHDEGEEDDAAAASSPDDSQSEGSVGSGNAEEAEVSASDESETEIIVKNDLPQNPTSKGLSGAKVANSEKDMHTSGPSPDKSPAVEQAEKMMNGLKLADETNIEGEQSSEHQTSRQGNGLPQSYSAAARRRDHEEYRKKRAEDPSFVPNRGGFFMHDHRTSAPGHNGFRPFGKTGPRDRGSGRGAANTSGPPASTGPNNGLWTHDLHETVIEPSKMPPPPIPVHARMARAQTEAVQAKSDSPAPNRSFSETIRLGTLSIRVFLAGMGKEATFSGVPKYLHVLLPYHRPPLRRDKPVRVSIPNSTVRYIFPATERSFIFIPRAMRPHQQGYGKAKARSTYGSFGAMSSRRTSIFGGSAYSPSVGFSRRSSVARDIPMTGFDSPTLPLRPQDQAAFDMSRPVVRLPPSSDAGMPPVFAASPVLNFPQQPGFFAPQPPPSMQQPAPNDIPMHHPKPERSLQMSGIESPVAANLQQQATRSQAFHQQVPRQYGSQYSSGPTQDQHSRQASHPSQTSGTPLSHIPEAAIHAQPFQPYSYSQSGYFPQQYSAPMYYYPPNSQGGESPVSGGSYVPGQQFVYPVAMGTQVEQTGQPGTLAHEAGGTVYYYNQSEMATSADSGSSYAPPYGSTQTPMDSAQFYPQQQLYYPSQ